MKKIRLTRKYRVGCGKKLLIIHPFNYKVSKSIWQAVKKGMLEVTECISIEEYVKKRDVQQMENMDAYDVILVLRDRTVWGGKGLFEWSRFIRHYVENDGREDITEQIIHFMREMSFPECICFIKEGKCFVCRKDKVSRW